MTDQQPSLRVSIIIAHTRSSVRATLTSLAEQTVDSKSFEAILVGHAPEHVVPEEYPFAVRYVECKELNPSLRRNLGMEKARAPIYAFIDDDACAERDWVRNALQELDGDPGLCLIGGPTLLPAGAGLAHRLTYKMAHAGFFGNGHENLSADSSDPGEVLGYITCCNMFVHAGRLAEDRRFDAHIGYGGEDSMFIYRISQMEGHGVRYSWSVLVYHSRGAFGYAYLRSRFRYRVNNGLILWAVPSLYLRNRKFALGMLLGTVIATLLVRHPLMILPTLLLHQAIAVAFSIHYWKDDWRLTVLFPPALLMQHAVYYIGVWAGLLSIVIPKQFVRVAHLREWLTLPHPPHRPSD